MKLNIDSSSLERLKLLTGVNIYRFLGFNVDLKDGTLTDEINSDSIYYGDYYNWLRSNLLLNYSNATLRALSGDLVKLGEFPDGLARENGFIKTAITPIVELSEVIPQSYRYWQNGLAVKPCSLRMLQLKSQR